MNENEGYWGGGISIISQIFPKSPSILFHPLDSSISQTSPKATLRLHEWAADGTRSGSKKWITGVLAFFSELN
jgi:hypothetical protein